MQLYEVCICIHIMWYIHIFKSPTIFLQKSVECPPHYFPSVVFTIYVYIYNFWGGSGVSSGCLEHPPTVPDCTKIIPICAYISSNLLLFLFYYSCDEQTTQANQLVARSRARSIDPAHARPHPIQYQACTLAKACCMH